MTNSLITNEGKLLIDPFDIKIKESLPRFRSEMGDVEDLAKSIKEKGQLAPIVINRQNELIYGGRRLAACMLGNLKAWVVYRDTADPIEMRELELEENIRRKAFTPAEEILAIAEIHKLRTARYGEPVKGTVHKEGEEKKGWTQEDTAEFVGKTRRSIGMDLALADALIDFPELKKCKTKSEITKAVKGLDKLNARIDALSQYEAQVAKNPEVTFLIEHGDGVQKCKDLESESIDVLLTDPPYGIDYGENSIGIGGQTGGFSTTGFRYEDDKNNALEVYSILAVESYRFTKSNGHAIVFLAPEHFWTVKTFFEIAGWNVAVRPFIWIKNSTGQNNNPAMWFSYCYEMALFARKTDSRLVLEGRGDWIQIPPVNESEKLHDAQKPVQLFKELLARLVLPGATVFDPFAGSGTTAIASLELKCFPICVDKGIESYSAILERIVKWQKAQI